MRTLGNLAALACTPNAQAVTAEQEQAMSEPSWPTAAIRALSVRT
jgi:hypothetical protein